MSKNTRSRNSGVKKYCEWCWNECNERTSFIPESPILEWIEEKLDKLDRDFILSKLSREEEIEIVVYDQMISQVREGRVCKSCWEKDKRLWDKYYEREDE